MGKKSMQQILPTVGAPRNRVENWLMPDRAQLTTHFEKPDPGHPRYFSRINVIELASIAAFVKAGVPASSAAALAGMVVRAELAGPFDEPQKEFCVFEAGKFETGLRTDDLSVENLKDLISGASPPALAIVHIGEIVRRVDALFTDAN